MKYNAIHNSLIKIVYSIIMICIVNILTGCEKHDGIEYYKSKCIAELDGQSFIDQTPFTITSRVTPDLYFGDDYLSFTTHLRAERTGPIVYCVDIIIYSNELDELLGKEIIIEKIDNFDIPEDDPFYQMKYIHYCIDNKISHAIMLRPLVNIDDILLASGSFKIISYDKERRNYHGTFTLNLSEGTLKGKFDI